MKILLTTLFLVSFSWIGLSQQVGNSDKIIEVYGQEWYDRMQVDAPDLLVLMDKYVDHGFSVRTVSEGKYDAELAPLEFIPLVSKTDAAIRCERCILVA